MNPSIISAHLGLICRPKSGATAGDRSYGRGTRPHRRSHPPATGAVQHLTKRIALEHLPVGTTLAEYDALILRVVSTPTATVFAYRWGDTLYPAVVDGVEGVRWLVMLSLDGMMETAFPPEAPETYLAHPQFHRLGTLEDLGL